MRAFRKGGSSTGRFKSPLSSTLYPDNWDEISRNCRKTRGHTCAECGVICPEDSGLLDVHHRNGDKSNCKPSNLVCLCKFCHSKEPFHEHYRSMLKTTGDLDVFLKQLRKLWEEQNIPHNKRG